MWNFSFIFPTFLILFIILVSYFSLPVLDIRRNRLFIRLIAIETLALILDILSSAVDNDPSRFGLFLTYLLNMLFFAFFFIRSHAIFIFTVSALRFAIFQNRGFILFSALPLILCLFFTVISPVSGSVFYIDESGYHAGTMYPLLYACSLFYLILSFIALILRDRAHVRKKETLSLLFSSLIILIGLVIRYMLPSYLLMDTFCLMALLVVYLNIENPEFCLDQQTRTFNRQALRQYIEEHGANRGRRFFGIILHKYGEMVDIYGSRHIEEGLFLIGGWLAHTFPNRPVFYVSRGRFVIAGDTQMDTEAMRTAIRSRFLSPWISKSAELYLNVNFAAMDLPAEELSTDLILSSMAAALDKADSIDDHLPVNVTEKDFTDARERIDVKRCFEEAVETKSIEVFLQPLIDAESGRIIGAEALSRIRDHSGTIIPPSVFIPVAESSGMINTLGEQVFEKTCRFIKENDLGSLGIEWINVNLSPLQFLRSDLAESYASLALKYGVDPQMVHLEITEESMVDDVFFQKQIEALSDKGFKFVLDDYGTGYSNLSRLKKCPFICIKLDMELVWDYCRNPDELLPMMIQAFRHMGFAITAEGIEDEHMAALMKSIGCDYFQGFLYSKPLPADRFQSLWLKQPQPVLR